MWVESELLEFGSLLQGPRMDVQASGTLTTEKIIFTYTLPFICAEVTSRLLLADHDLAGVRQTYELGIELGVPESDLNDIQDTYWKAADKRREMLNTWMKIDMHPSWRKLVRALVTINERFVARKIAEKYGNSYCNIFCSMT